MIGYLIRDCLGGILFEIEEDTIDEVLNAYASDFDWGVKCGWPCANAKGPDSVKAFVHASGAKVYRIQGSTTFDGFVVAQSMAVEAAEPPDGSGEAPRSARASTRLKSRQLRSRAEARSNSSEGNFQCISEKIASRDWRFERYANGQACAFLCAVRQQPNQLEHTATNRSGSRP